MVNPKSGLTLASWQLISLAAGSFVILGLAGFGLWNLLFPKGNITSQNSPTQNAVQQKLIGQWKAQVSSGSSQQPVLLIFADNNKFYAVQNGDAVDGSYQVIDTSAKPQKIIFTIEAGKGTTVSQTLNLVDDRQMVSIAEPITNFQKVSDTGVLPEGTRFPQALARQSEARNNIGTINRAQQAFYLEKARFASTIVEAGVGISEESDNYKYTMVIVDEKQMVWFIATPKTERTKNYIGITKLISENNQKFTRSVACESLQPTANVAPKPYNAGRETDYPTCPEGYRDLTN